MKRAESPVVIVGGGLGGLAAGVRLVQAGVRAVIVEQHRETGGYVTAFDRKGYTFDPAMHAIPAGAPGDFFHEQIEALGIEDAVSLIKVPEGFSTVLGQRRFQFPNNPDELFDSLAHAFPPEREGLRRLRAEIAHFGPFYVDVVEGRMSKLQKLTRFVPRIPVFLHHTDLPTDAYLARFTHDPVLQALLFQPAVFCGLPSHEFPAINFIVMLYMLFERGLYTIRDGGCALSRALTKRFVALGGEVLSGTQVTRVCIRRRRAAAVRTDDGVEIPASAVVANVSTPVFVRDLVGTEHFPTSYVRALERLESSLSVVELHIGLDCSLADAGINAYLTTVFPDHSIDDCIRRQRELRHIEAGSITAQGVADPAAGTRNPTMSVVGAVDPRAWLSLDPDSYRSAKQECTERTLGLLESVYPGTHGHYAVLDLATPRTFQRYTGNPDGAIMGFSSRIGAHRPLLTVSRIPIPNVYLANAWTLRFGGMLQAMRAGVTAAERCIGTFRRRTG